MKLSQQTQNNIEESVKTALAAYADAGDGKQPITDIHLQPDFESGELLVMDDDDRILSRTPVPEWADSDDETTYKDVEGPLRNALKRLKENGILDATSLMKPYSFTLIDDSKETVAELLLVDDDTLLLCDDELLKGLDEELDAFLKELMEN